jgi:hypothetical protein
VTNIAIVIVSLFIALFAHNHAMIVKSLEENKRDREQYKQTMEEISRRLKQ